MRPALGLPASLPASLPYFAAFILAPLAVLAGRLAGGGPPYDMLAPQGLGLWLALSALATLAALAASARKRAESGRSARPLLGVALALCLGGWLFFRLLELRQEEIAPLASLLFELRLPAAIVFAGLWAWSFGTPDRDSLSKAGAVLGALSVLDFLLTAIMAKSLVLGGGYLFGEGAAMADIIGLLLCLALCATLGETPAPGVPRLARWLILAGILAGFSKPALLAAGLLTLTLERGPVRLRLGASGLCALALWMSVAMPLPRTATEEDFGLAWHWGAVNEAMSQEARALWTGLPLDQPVALALPEFQGLIWDAETDGLPVYVSDVPSSGLRLFAGWGLGAPLALVAGAVFCALRGKSRFALGLAGVLLICGTLSAAPHAPAAGGAMALAFISAARRTNKDKDAATPGGEA